MQENKKTLLPYNLGLTVPAAVFCVAALAMLIISIAISAPFLIPMSVALLVASVSIMMQNKTILLENNRITVKYFFGIIKEQKFTPVECGFFVSQASTLQKPTYIDKRVIRGDISDEAKKYIYISEYILSKQEQEGSQFIYNEPVLILDYSKELYSALNAVFEFNCEPFDE